MKRLEKASDFAIALAKGHLASTGVSYDDMERPIIGVVNSWNEIVPGHVPLRQIADWVKEGVRLAGGLPLEFNTIAICDGIAQGTAGMRYPLASRELIADSIEAMVKGHGIFDGLVFLTACDKITPAMLLAAARLNLPSIFVTSGPMHHFGDNSGRKSIRKRFLAGEVSERELVEGGLEFYSGPGVCPFFGTASTMLVVMETLGLALSGSALIPAGSAERSVSCRRAGEHIVSLVKEDLRPCRILTTGALRNAIRVILALGGSLNSLLHLPALAGELGLTLTWADFDRLSRETPLLSALVPSGPHSATDLFFAGGVPAVMAELASMLDLSGPSVNPAPWTEVLARARVKNRDVIHSLANPLSPEGGVAVLFGSLAPAGAVVKTSAVPPEQMVFTGPARVFDDEEDCIRTVEKGEVADGSVIVIRYEGPQGGPGMREMHLITEVAGDLHNVAIITDGRYSGATAGLSIGYVCPEAYEGGPIALLRDGDSITIDIPQRRLDVLISEAELTERRRLWRRVEKGDVSSYLQSYRQSVGPACNGARRHVPRP